MNIITGLSVDTVYRFPT